MKKQLSKPFCCQPLASKQSSAFACVCVCMHANKYFEYDIVPLLFLILNSLDYNGICFEIFMRFYSWLRKEYFFKKCSQEELQVHPEQ